MHQLANKLPHVKVKIYVFWVACSKKKILNFFSIFPIPFTRDFTKNKNKDEWYRYNNIWTKPSPCISYQEPIWFHMPVTSQSFLLLDQTKYIFLAVTNRVLKTIHLFFPELFFLFDLPWESPVNMSSEEDISFSLLSGSWTTKFLTLSKHIEERLIFPGN